MKLKTTFCLGVMGVVFASPYGVAENTPDELETVTIIGRIPRPLLMTEASVSVIDAAAIDNAMALDLRDLVSREPGISVRGDATRFGDDSISIRGISGNRVRLDVDGVPRAAAFAVGSFSDAGRALSGLDFIKRIEILRGPASATYGSAAIGGIVAVSTFDPADLIDADRDRGARGRLQYSSVNDAAHASVLLAGRADGGGGQSRDEWLFGWAHERAGESENGSEIVRANPQSIVSNAWLGKYVLGAWNEPIRISLFARERQSKTNVASLVLQPGRFVNTTAMDGDDRTSEFKFAVDRTTHGDGVLEQFDWRVWVQRAVTEQRTFESRRAVAPRTPASNIDRSFRYDVDAAGMTAVASFELPGATFQHHWAVGFEGAVQRISEARDGVQVTQPDGSATKSILGEVFPLRDFPKSDVLDVGAFVFDEISLLASGFVLSPALRVDHYRLDPRVDAVYSEDNPNQRPAAMRSTSVSPRLGVSRKFGGGVVAFGQYTHGYRAPPFEDVNIGLDIPLFRYRALPNPDLRPERSDHLEFGLRASGARSSAVASVFGARYRDFIESKVSLGVDPSTGYTLFQSRNRSRAQIYGVEAKFDVELDRSSTARAWEASFAMAYARGKDESTSLPLNGIDPLRATMMVAYSPLHSRWRVESLVTAVASQNRVDQSVGALAHAAGYATVDLTARWDVSRAVRIRAALLNVFDRRYSEWSDVRGRLANDPSLPLFVRPGRSVTAGVTLQLE